jgi:hypothetical protein
MSHTTTQKKTSFSPKAPLNFSSKTSAFDSSDGYPSNYFENGVYDGESRTQKKSIGKYLLKALLSVAVLAAVALTVIFVEQRSALTTWEQAAAQEVHNRANTLVRLEQRGNIYLRLIELNDPMQARINQLNSSACTWQNGRMITPSCQQIYNEYIEMLDEQNQLEDTPEFKFPMAQPKTFTFRPNTWLVDMFTTNAFDVQLGESGTQITGQISEVNALRDHYIEIRKSCDQPPALKCSGQFESHEEVG